MNIFTRLRMKINQCRAEVAFSKQEAGQIIVVFAIMLTALIGMVGIAIDVTYAWRAGLQVQRAADAAALAGVVYMPGDLSTATTRADVIAAANGYTISGNTNVTVSPNPVDNHQLDVSITATVPTFFARLFGINSWTVTRDARAAYILPVQMGSPLNYYGIGCLVLAKPATNPPCNNGGTGLSGVTDGGNTFASLGGWGSIITKGGNQQNGDAYAPANNAGGNGFDSGANTAYDDGGYNYTVVLPAGGGIKIFDPGFCAMGNNPSGAGVYGAGDHWIDHDSNNTNVHSPVSTYYILWNTHDQPLNQSAWTQVSGSYSGSLFENQKGSDTNNGGPANGSGYSTSSCDAYHDTWWVWPSAQGLVAGTYEVEVTTTNDGNSTINQYTNAENMFAIEAVGGANPTVFGQSRMSVYNNLAGGSQKFYLGKVDQQTGIGKTLEIDLFDIGDVSGDGVLKIWSPAGPGGSQVLTTFNYTADSNWNVSVRNRGGTTTDAQNGNGVSQIRCAIAGDAASSFNNTWIRIYIPLGNTYGNSGLWQGGWWQIEYIAGSASDTTTWSVNVIGNPVHLVSR
jgi:Flp pilus assembly protein TadG